MGVKGIATPPAGDARATLAAYATHTGLPSFVVAPQDAPGSCIQQARLYGNAARAYRAEDKKRFFMGKRLAWSGKLLLVVVAYTTAFTVQICYAT